MHARRALGIPKYYLGIRILYMYRMYVVVYTRRLPATAAGLYPRTVRVVQARALIWRKHLRWMRWDGMVLSVVGSAVAAAALRPPAPDGLVCETANATSTSITLRWDRVVGADFYDMQCSGAGSHIFTKPFVSVGGPSTAATVESLLPNTTLTCQVRAHRFAATGFYHHNTLVGDWSELSTAKVQCST
eukprot:COSAG02_NODE_12776_length_1496_cov_1.524696_2_plen_187_part_01